jgi:hypothetical protein
MTEKALAEKTVEKVKRKKGKERKRKRKGGNERKTVIFSFPQMKNMEEKQKLKHLRYVNRGLKK